MASDCTQLTVIFFWEFEANSLLEERQAFSAVIEKAIEVSSAGCNIFRVHSLNAHFTFPLFEGGLLELPISINYFLWLIG